MQIFEIIFNNRLLEGMKMKYWDLFRFYNELDIIEKVMTIIIPIELFYRIYLKTFLQFKILDYINYTLILLIFILLF